MDNSQIADRLDAFASLLELAEANPYAARAYRRAAETLRGANVPVVELVRSGRARELRGIGPSIEAKLRELVETGGIAELAELEREISPDLVGLGRYLGLGAKRSLELARSLGIHTADELRDAAAAGQLRSVPGIGPKTEAQLLYALAREPEPRPRQGLLLNRAWELVGGIAAALGGEAAGDVRRWRDSCEWLVVFYAAGATRPRQARAVRDGARPRDGLIGVRQRPRANAGCALRGCGLQGARASLVSTGAARGAVPRRAPAPGGAGADPRRPHSHTTWSDGRATVEEMARAARALGYKYLAICDHTPAVGAVPGLNPDDVRRQAEEIAAANELLAPFRVLRGIECDILSDGRLDLPDDVLAELDWVQASVHGGQRMPRDELTKRVEEALRNPNVNCLSHPKGRYINRRPENALDLERVFAVALEEGVALEVNGLPDRRP